MDLPGYPSLLDRVEFALPPCCPTVIIFRFMLTAEFGNGSLMHGWEMELQGPARAGLLASRGAPSMGLLLRVLCLADELVVRMYGLVNG